MTPQQAFQQALEHHQANRLEQARLLYLEALEGLPSLAGAWHNLGLIAHAQEDDRQALPYLRRAAELEPHTPEFLYTLGFVAQGMGEQTIALEALRQALRLRPDWLEAALNLGAACLALGLDQEAAQAWERALSLEPGNQTALMHLAALYLKVGLLAQAELLYRQALRLDPGNAAALNNLATVLIRLGQPREALEALRKALALTPDFPEARKNLAGLMLEQGQPEQAEEFLLDSLRGSPQDAELLVALGAAQEARRQPGLAHESYLRALELDPRHAAAHFNLGRRAYLEGQVLDSLMHYRRAIASQPDHAPSHFNLGTGLLVMGGAAQAVEAFARAHRLRPRDPVYHSTLLHAMQYDPDQDADARLAQARAWQELQAGPSLPPLPPRQAPRGPRPDRRMRLGYVSGDFCVHPVGLFLEAVLPHHDRQSVEVFCYANDVQADEFTPMLRGHAEHWRDIGHLDDRQAARLIREDGIDVLIDLAGHTPKNRLLTFARRPAPVQATWLGYFATTGLAAMDYIIADPHIIPIHEEGQYVEKVARLPAAYICMALPRLDLPVAPLPALHRGQVTFGCFNNLAKVGPQVLDLWAQVLARVPQGRLFLKTRSLDDPKLRDYLTQEMADRGVEPDRLRLEGHSLRGQLLASYGEVDIALDPFPYGGGVTTMEALWMGAPVLTLRGDRFVGHHAETILRTLGLDLLVTDSGEQYLERAVALAGDLASLARLRAGLRPLMSLSPLCDGPGFTRQVERLFRELWLKSLG